MNDQLKEFLKANQPIPATDEERASLMKVSKKGIYIIFLFAIVIAVVWLKDGAEIKALGFWGVFLLVIAVVILGLEMKDKIKIKSYKKIYSTYLYIESAYYVNKAYHMTVTYYDPNYAIFNKTKMNIDRVDVLGQRIENGEIIRVFVGEKNSKIHYIAMKSA